MDDSFPCSHPLYITVSVPSSIANGVGMIADGSMVDIGKRKEKVVKVHTGKKARKNQSTHGSLESSEAKVFNAALDLLKAERCPVGDGDGVQLIVQGEEMHRGRTLGSKNRLKG